VHAFGLGVSTHIDTWLLFTVMLSCLQLLTYLKTYWYEK